MEYSKKRRYTINTDVIDLKELYPHDLQMYDNPPEGEMQFQEFQQLGLDRLKLLQHVESNAGRTDLTSIDKRKESLREALTKDGLKYYMHLLRDSGSSSSSESDLLARRKDHISHFILRLSYCRDADGEAWFINQEVELFKMRFSSLNKEGREQLLSMHDIDCHQITEEEREEIREELRCSTPKISSVSTSDFYKVPFQKVPDLLRGRRAYFNDGYGYISQTDLVSLFLSYFRTNLTNGMEDARACVANISDDTRLTSYFKSLPGSFSGMTRVVWTTTTTPVEKLDELSKTSYPLCMRTLHDALKTHHHLKNSGRIQYGLFIKGIGVTLEDALRFWKTEFSKKIDGDKFDKQYAYSIRHTFGKEGKQTNYTPLGCPKIVATSVGPGEYHGCPYRHMDQDSLRQKLNAYGLPPNSISEILAQAKSGQYLHACKKYFETVHNRETEKIFMHPNEYFVESRTILAKDDPSADAENIEKLSQTGRFNERVSGTPRRMDTSSRIHGTPARNIDKLPATPTRSFDSTPSVKTERHSVTPSRRLSKVVSSKKDLGDDEIAMMIDDS